MELVGAQANAFALIARLVTNQKETYRLERHSEFLVTPRRVVQPDSKIVYKATNLNVLTGQSWDDHDMTLTCFFYDKDLGSGVQVTDRETNKVVAVASLTWDNSTTPLTPIWYIFTLDPPYPGARPVKEQLGDSTLYCFGLVKEDEGLVVSMSHPPDKTRRQQAKVLFEACAEKDHQMDLVELEAHITTCEANGWNCEQQKRELTERVTAIEAAAAAKEAATAAAKEPKPESEAELDGSRAAFILQSPGCGLGNDFVINPLDAHGNLKSASEAVAYCTAILQENVQTGKTVKSYDVDIAPGVDAALMLLTVIIKDWEVGRQK